jgi:hypothetical protein
MTGLADKLNDKGAQLYRTSVRNLCLRPLASEDMPADEAKAGRVWLEQPGRTTHDIERLKDRTIDRLREVRNDHPREAAA